MYICTFPIDFAHFVFVVRKQGSYEYIMGFN